MAYRLILRKFLTSSKWSKMSEKKDDFYVETKDSLKGYNFPFNREKVEIPEGKYFGGSYDAEQTKDFLARFSKELEMR